MSRKITYSILTYILIFANLFFLSALISYNLVIKGETSSLPNLIGKTVEEAKTELAKKRLFLGVKGEQFDNTWEKGRVVRQEPSAGSKIRLSGTARVTLSAGSELVAVPDLKGKTVESSVLILRDSGLMRGTVSHVYTSQYAAGKIIAQQPLPLEKSPKNTQVNLLVSRGERDQKYLMPDLTSMKAETVIAKLREMEFKVADVRYTYYPGRDAGIIITQLPPPGFSIQKNSLIALEISKE